MRWRLTTGGGGRGGRHLYVHRLPAAQGEIRPRCRWREGRPSGREDSLHGRPGHRAVAVAPHNGGSAPRCWLNTPGVAAVVSDAADLQRGHTRGGPEDVQGLAETQSGQRDSGHLQQDVSNPQSARLPGRLQGKYFLDPDEVCPGCWGLRTSVNGKSQSQGIPLNFHLKCVVEIRKFRYEESIWFLSMNLIKI